MKTTILYLSPREAKPRLGEHRLGPAITLLDQNHQDATIIVNRRLPMSVQKAFLKHEGTQLGVIRQMFREGYSFQQSCRTAHEAGVAAGCQRAKKLGVLEKYIELRERK